MFDFGLGTSEILLIAMVALIVVGPKELPGLLRTIGRWVGQLKALAADFQGHIDDLTRESGVKDVKKGVEESLEELSIEDLDREFKEMEAELRQQLAAGAEKPGSKPSEAEDEDLLDDEERPLPDTLDLDADPEESGEDGERDDEEASDEELDRQFEAEIALDERPPGGTGAREKEGEGDAPASGNADQADTDKPVSAGPKKSAARTAAE